MCANNSTPVICHNCHQPGHYQRQCPQIQQTGNNTITPVQNQSHFSNPNRVVWNQPKNNSNPQEQKVNHNSNNFAQQKGVGSIEETKKISTIAELARSLGLEEENKDPIQEFTHSMSGSYLNPEGNVISQDNLEYFGARITIGVEVKPSPK